MAPTPSPRPLPTPQTPLRTPHSKHRLHFPHTEHPVEVIARIRTSPHPSILNTSPTSISVVNEAFSRDFALDGVSVADAEDLATFYNKYISARIEGVRGGDKCTIMMYGPTGSGKSYTMFGCARQQGIVYRALRDILGDGDGSGVFVQVGVLEIFNEEIYDLLNERGVSVGPPPKGGTPKVRLEVMGKKAKNATYISGNEAWLLSKEVARVEKRRIVKSTLCNERSSRSHCMIILDVPSVGGRLMLVDMAGSENIEQAGQIGLEAKIQTAKINQGNIALKRVVESIANGDSHVPFRDSKLTMLLQDSFEDDKSKILMVLCASPDPKEMHKTISTLEYGAKAKCIVRAAHMPTPKDKMNMDDSALLRSRISAMNQFICKLQMENKLKEKERDDAHKELLRREEELTQLKSKLKLVEGKGSVAKEEEINLKVDERTQMMRLELRKTEEMMLQQKEELASLRKRLEEIECDRNKVGKDSLDGLVGGRFMKCLSEMHTGDQAMVESMDLDMGDQQIIHDVKEIKEDQHQCEIDWNGSLNSHFSDVEDDVGAVMLKLPGKVNLSTVFEEDAEGDIRESTDEDEVDKEVVEESVPQLSRTVEGVGSILNPENFAPNYNSRGMINADCGKDSIDSAAIGSEKDSLSFRKTRIQNIFRLCGNHRELAHHARIPTPSKDTESPISPLHEPFSAIHLADDMKSNVSPLHEPFSAIHLADDMKSNVSPSIKTSACGVYEDSKENSRPGELGEDEMISIFVKWESSKELSGNLIKKFKVWKNSTLVDLRKQIEDHLDRDNNKQQFTFLLLGDPSGAPISKDKEATVHVTKLPSCSNQLNARLACLRPIKKALQHPNHVPFISLENMLPSGVKLAGF